MKPGVAGTRCAARCFVLGRAHMCHMGAPCVLAAHSRSAPRPTSVIVIRALRERLAVLAFAALVVAAIVGGALGLGYLVGKLLL